MTPVVDPLIDWPLAVAIFFIAGIVIGALLASWWSLRSEERGEARRLQQQMRRHPAGTDLGGHVRIKPW